MTWLPSSLMALTLVPKKEIFLTYLGQTDTTYNDVSIGVVLNPLLILAAIALLVHDGWRAACPGWALRASFAACGGSSWTLAPWRGGWGDIGSFAPQRSIPTAHERELRIATASGRYFFRRVRPNVL